MLRIREISHEGVELGRLEPGDLKVKITFGKQCCEITELAGKEGAVPARICSDLVVCKGESALLNIAQTGHHNNRNLSKPKLLGCEIPTNSRDNIAVFIDQNWVGPTKSDDAIGNLIYLLFGMGSRIARQRLEISKRFKNDLNRIR